MQERVLSGADKIIIDGKSTSGVVPFLPLSEFTTRPAPSEPHEAPVIDRAVLTTLSAILGLAAASLVSAFHAGSTEAAVNFRALPLILAAGLAAGYTQFACAVAVDGSGLKPHWRSAAIAPLYPVYFWGLLITSFLGGFPKGWLRRDKGTWQRTIRRAEKPR
ncbi:MAG: hypothetical protein HC855_16160, partial [Rhizobiales bacterium]|nr:hypothetical protein [Hyphomicrobiales bacterium]